MEDLDFFLDFSFGIFFWNFEVYFGPYCPRVLRLGESEKSLRLYCISKVSLSFLRCKSRVWLCSEWEVKVKSE